MFHKYIIFLPNKYFKKSFFNSNHKKIKKSLNNKGIFIYNYEKSIKMMEENSCFLFDDRPFPNINQLYIHLFNYEYYSDNLYSKRKIEKEKDMLILLSGILGIKKIEYSIENKEIFFSKVDAGINIKNINSQIKYQKILKKNEDIYGVENYINKGSSIYLSNDIDIINNEIKNLDSNIFSYDFYKNNLKLQTFVYKRIKFNMLEMEYTIEVDDVSDISISVKSCLMDYGIHIIITDDKYYNEIIKCKFEFYTNFELEIALYENKMREHDKFLIIKDIYKINKNIDNIYNYIVNDIINNTNKNKLKDWIIQNFNEFENACSNFKSTIEIKSWLNKIIIK